MKYINIAIDQLINDIKSNLTNLEPFCN